MSQIVVISQRDFDDVITSLEWALEEGADFECNCEPHHEFDTNATIHRDNCATSMQDHLEITLENIKAARSGGRPATQIEVEAMNAIARLQDENRELKERLSRITREVEDFRQLAVKRGLMIGEIRAWQNIKKLTIYYKPEEPGDG
jgi:hypothetical protein